MNLVLLLFLCLVGFGQTYGVSDSFNLKTDIMVSPRTQEVNEYENAVVYCNIRDGKKVYWERLDGSPLPKQAIQKKGKLLILKIRSSDGGYYVCYNENRLLSKTVFIAVRPNPTTVIFSSTPTASSTVLMTQGWSSTQNRFTTHAYTSSTPYPCMYGICNGTCCENNAPDSLFDCANGQKINKILVCNRVNDCEDGSDESICAPWPSKITVLPKHKVEVFCGDKDEEKSGTLILECESVGHPTPLVRWKKYDGHVPSKCQQYSKNGHGILTCPNFKQSDQGAYSCVAENSVKSAESQPKSVARCSNSINCQGFKVVNEEQIEHCLDCYCSGKSSVCQNLKSTTSTIKVNFTETITEIFAEEDGQVMFIPTKTEFTPSYKVMQNFQKVTYCSFLEEDLHETSFLKSFGRNIIIPRYKGEVDFIKNAPDLIIQGNNSSLLYSAKILPTSKNNTMDMSVKFWPGNWHHLNKKTATRQDLMKVLANIHTVLVRCEYQRGKLLKWSNNETLSIETSTITDFTNSVSYVEKCNCPMGYDGLSCETCAAGYTRNDDGTDFVCEADFSPICSEGHIGKECDKCDTDNGYYQKSGVCTKSTCHSQGSLSLQPNTWGKCECREGVTGDFCDRCKNDSFYLHKAKGCIKCWCSGITNQCKSSNLYRTVISNIPRGGYNSSDGRNFWLLPSDFSGNRLTSYGGSFNYTMKYKPQIRKQNNVLTVEFLSTSDVTLIYTHLEVDNSTLRDEKSWTVPLIENNWRKGDKSSVTRGEFLSVLSRIKAIYIESPYHLSSGLANLTSARMSSASSFGDYDSELALNVEQCICPVGYTGLSCETCSQGYYKMRNGTITQCVKCNCSYCDPEFGCPDCSQLMYRDNPEEEKVPVCKPCPCNGNGVSCLKDDHNQIFCQCKKGFSGMHCENTLAEEKNELTITMSPRKIRGKKVGTNVQFNCSLKSNEEMTLSGVKSFIQNYNNDSAIFYRHGSNLSENFEVVLEPGMKAVQCAAHDSEGRLAGFVQAVIEDLITNNKPVKITDCYSYTIDVKESESKDIICETTGSPPPVVNWYKRINGFPAEKVDSSDGVHTIESPSLSDNGTIYTCVAENSEGDKDTCTRVLIVREKCEVINIFPKVVRGTEGENITVECKTTAKSLVTWSELDQFFRRERTISSSRIQVHGGQFQIINATISESGMYICVAKGQNGEINQTLSVTIEEKRVPPIVHIKEYDKTLKEGENFTATCTATGKPIPNVTWRKLNGTLDWNANLDAVSLVINRATFKNAGIYACEARSIAGNATAYISLEVEKVMFPPRVNMSEEYVNAHDGDEVSLSCLAIGHPKPIISWFASEINFTVTPRISDMVLIEPQESVKEEITFKVTKDMDGKQIICFADNNDGRDQKSAVIKVLQSKGGINETVELVSIGSYFELQCDFLGDVKWEKIGGLVGDECPIPNALMIQSVQVQHNGTYLCKDHQDSKKIINLIVIGHVPKFSRASRSYLVLPVQLELHKVKWYRVELSFRPTRESGVLLQQENNKLTIYLEDRKVHMSIYSNEQDFLDIVMNNTVSLGHWYSLAINIDINYVDITIYNEDSLIHDRKIERSKDFIISMETGKESFFVGGPLPRSRHIRMFTRRFSTHFDGCISRLSINRHEFDIVKESSYSRNVTLCKKCSERPNPCLGKGQCLDAPTQYGFICICPNNLDNKSETCPAGCAGKGCETQLDLCSLLKPCNGGFIHKCTNKMYSLQCHCAYGYSGTTCEKVQEYSFCAKGNGYVKLPSYLLERHVGMAEVIRMAFTLHKPSGQLLWQGKRENHLSISVRKGILHYVYLNQHTKLEVSVASEVSLNEKYLLFIRRMNNTVTLELTRTPQTVPELYRNSTIKTHTNRVVGDIYLGNVPNNTHHIGYHVGLTGCIHYISFRDKAKINFPENNVEKFNVFLPKKLYRSNDYESEESYYNDDSSYNEITSPRFPMNLRF